MRKVDSADQIDDAYRQCAAEAQLGFGNPALFAEALLDGARHIEVQIVAAPAGHQTHALALGDRDCSIQRRYQKLVEIAPAQCLSDILRRGLHQAASRLCARVGLRGLATVEFLVASEKEGAEFVFLEVNPRIQVEHTVTEETTGVDLVAVQLAIAGGASYYQLRFPPESPRMVAKSSASRPHDRVSRFKPGSTWRLRRRRVRPAGSRHTDDVLAAQRPGSTRRHLRTSRAEPPALGMTRCWRRSPRTCAPRSSPRRCARPGPRWPISASRVLRTNSGFLRELLSDSRLQPGWVTTSFLDEKLPELAAAALSHPVRHPGRGGRAVSG